jgi:hypothetical protein
MRQQDRRQTGEVLGLVPLEPQDLGGRETRQHRVAQGLVGFLGTTHRGCDFGTFRSRDRVAPEFGGSDHPVLGVERNEPMLLTTHTDGDDFGRLGLGGFQGRLNGPGRGSNPLGGILFLGSGREPGQETVRGRTLSQDAAGDGINDQRLGGLRAGIDADKK